MKKSAFLSLLGLFWISFLLTWCLEKPDQPENLPTHQEKQEEKSEIISLSAFGTEPFWDLTISGNEAVFFEMSMEEYENKKTFPITMRIDQENYVFFNTELEGSFEKKSCVDGGKGDLHEYTVTLTYQGTKKFEGCGDFGNNDENTEFWADVHEIEPFLQTCQNTIPLEFYDIPGKQFSRGLVKNVGPFYKVPGVLSFQQQGERKNFDFDCIFDITQDSTDAYPLFGDRYLDEEEEKCLKTIENTTKEPLAQDSQTFVSLACAPKQYGIEFYSGYIYTSTYEDLGIEVETSKGFNAFLQKEEKSDLERHGHRISYFAPYGEIQKNEYEYLQVFDKKPDEDLKLLIEKKHFAEGCTIKTENYFFQDLVESPEGVLIYSTHKEAEEGSIACIVGEPNYEEEKYNAYRFFESRDKTKYYQVSFRNQCGAGPCSRFGKIRLL